MDRQNDGDSDTLGFSAGEVQLVGDSRLGAQMVLPRFPQCQTTYSA